MTTCLILAAGDAERHNGGNKPLLEVNGETLLARTLRLMQPVVGRAIVVTHRQDLVDAFSGGSIGSPDCDFFLPKVRRWIVETLLSTRSQWPENDGPMMIGATIVLLADVFYTEEAIKRIRSSGRQIFAFGKECNIHALLWFGEHNNKIASELQKAATRAEESPSSYGAGKLWTFLANGMPEVPVIDFGDETTDFDSPLEHKRFVEKYGNRSTHRTG